jgi:hypothetical protein
LCRELAVITPPFDRRFAFVPAVRYPHRTFSDVEQSEDERSLERVAPVVIVIPRDGMDSGPAETVEDFLEWSEDRLHLPLDVGRREVQACAVKVVTEKEEDLELPPIVTAGEHVRHDPGVVAERTAGFTPIADREDRQRPPVLAVVWPGDRRGNRIPDKPCKENQQDNIDRAHQHSSFHVQEEIYRKTRQIPT